MNRDEFAELSAGHALGALSPDDVRALDAALAEHPEWASIVETDAATAAELADGVAEIDPPADVRAALLARIAAPGARAGDGGLVDPGVDAAGEEPERSVAPERSAAAEPSAPTEPAPSTEAIQTVARRSWTRGLLALAASFVLLIALGTTAVMLGDRLRAPESVDALEQINAAPDARSATAAVEGGGTASLHWSESLGKAVVETQGLDEASADETYELWFVRGGTPVSAGQFDTDESGAATALLEGPVQPGDVIAVTVEPEGGSPTGQPTSDPIVAIPTD